MYWNSQPYIDEGIKLHPTYAHAADGHRYWGVAANLAKGLGYVYDDNNDYDNKNFSPPEKCIFNLSGKIVCDKMVKQLEKLYNDKVILDHGMEVGKELANVLSGGDTTIDKTLNEDDLYKLELDAFMRLIETQKTQQRIKHTLTTGKPLVN